jgi:acetyl esterase
MDRETRAVLEALSAAFPRVETMGASEARAAVATFGQPPREVIEVARVQDVDTPLPMRAYWPLPSEPATTTRPPVIVHFHGGGFVLGSIDASDASAREWCAGTGCVVVTIDYRLAPEHPFPAAVDDAYMAIEWVAANADALGVDPARMAVAGDSAGATLAAAACLAARDRGAPAPRCQVLAYPMLDPAAASASQHEFAQGYFLTHDAIAWYWRQYLGSDRSARSNPLASPLAAEYLGGLPSAIVVTAEYDPLRDEGEDFTRRLAAAGTPVTHRRARGLFHGFLAFAAPLPRARAERDSLFAATSAALEK